MATSLSPKADGSDVFSLLTLEIIGDKLRIGGSAIDIHAGTCCSIMNTGPAILFRSRQPNE